jgi:hypothetical protein
MFKNTFTDPTLFVVSTATPPLTHSQKTECRFHTLQRKVASKLLEAGNTDFDAEAHSQLAEYAFQLYDIGKSRAEAAEELADGEAKKLKRGKTGGLCFFSDCGVD